MICVYIVAWSLGRRSECSNPDFVIGNGIYDTIFLYFELSHDLYKKYKYFLYKFFDI